MREGSTMHVGSENYSGRNRLVVRSSRTGTAKKYRGLEKLVSRLAHNQ